MNLIYLTTFDLVITSTLVLLVALLGLLLKLHISSQFIIAALRTAAQLTLVGYFLKAVFENTTVYWLILIALVMLVAAGREVARRQKKKFKGLWAFGFGAAAMLVSTFTITILVLVFVIQNTPWYTPQYAIPVLGMMLGNTMNGISIGLDRLTTTTWQQKAIIENRLMLGQEWNVAIGDIRQDSIRSGLIPIINTMSVAGLVSLPGMMTGQILAGTPPVEAVKYQILIMFMIAGGTGMGTVLAVWLGSKRLFDKRQRLRLDRLKIQG